MGKAAILLAVRTGDQFPNPLDGFGIGAHLFGDPPRAVGVAQVTARGERARDHALCIRVVAGGSQQLHPGLRQIECLAARRPVPDAGAVFQADHDRIPLIGLIDPPAHCGRIGESEVPPHDGCTGMEGEVGGEIPDGVEQLLSLPALQPDEFDRAAGSGNDLAAAWRRCNSE